jgi:thiol-disulfide isomerase/thioredoxin
MGEDGKFSLKEHRGKVVVVNFWFTTCTPCVAELPHFNEAADAYSDDVVIIAIHIEQDMGEELALKWINKLHPDWLEGKMLVAWDTGKVCEQLFEVNGMCPTTVVINGDGVITDKIAGSLTKADLTQAIEKALNGK